MDFHQHLQALFHGVEVVPCTPLLFPDDFVAHVHLIAAESDIIEEQDECPVVTWATCKINGHRFALAIRNNSVIADHLLYRES